MDAVKKQLTAFVSNKSYLLVVVIALCFIAAALYTWRRYVSPKINPTYVANNEYKKDQQTSDVVDLYYFYTTWCPHCKKSMPIWQALKSDIGDTRIKGYRVNFLEVDCDKDKSLADKFNVQGYPTILMVKGNSVISFDAKPNKDTLIEFLNSSL